MKGYHANHVVVALQPLERCKSTDAFAIMIDEKRINFLVIVELTTRRCRANSFMSTKLLPTACSQLTRNRKSLSQSDRAVVVT